jgi:hypothetical protein
MLRDGPRDEEGVNEHQAVLQQLEREGRDLLLFAAVGGKDALATIAEKIVCGIPAFDDVQAFLHLVPQIEGRQILTEVDRL